MMIKYAAIFSVLIVIGEGQRSPYAGSVNQRYPVVLPRFQEEQDNLTSTTTVAPIVNRLGDDTANSTLASNSGAAQAPASTATPALVTVPTTTSELPVLALGQGEFVDRIKTWPEDQRPFWWTNRNQIAAHLNPVNPVNVINPNVNTRGTFEGRK